MHGVSSDASGRVLRDEEEDDDEDNDEDDAEDDVEGNEEEEEGLFLLRGYK